MSHRAPTLYIPHGAGPCFFMEWTQGPADCWDRMGDFLERLGDALPRRPDAIVVISAHWEEDLFTVTGQANPPLLYDYDGFPEHTYRLRYDAPGSPALAREIRELLGAAGIPSRAERERGFDHGVFIPFKLIFPDADIPIVQLSLKSGLDPARHLEAGAAIAPLRDQNVLIVGSGMSWRTMAAFRDQTPQPQSEIFDSWLNAAAADPDPRDRNDRLLRWAEAPAARDAHPCEEHLMPLMVAAGAAANDLGRRTFTDAATGCAVSGFQFG
jgi:aromatic ring-opening dioxygenase catalytic subunit (LigB family)